jgi:hypothetical protein
MVGTSRTRVALRDNPSNRWRVTVWPTLEADLVHFPADLSHGPKMKFAKLGLTYNFD